MSNSSLIEQISQVLILAHALNEARHEPLSPLCIGEVWVQWNEYTPKKKDLDVVIRLFERPPGMKAFEQREWSQVKKYKATEVFVRKSLEVLGISNKNALRWLENEITLLENPKRYGLMIYKDSRSEEPVGQGSWEKEKKFLALQRKVSLFEQTRTSAHLFADIAKCLAKKAFEEKRPSLINTGARTLTLADALSARKDGEEHALSLIEDAEFWVNDPERRGFGYDMYCRELSQLLIEYADYNQSQHCIDGFFSVLSNSHIWGAIGATGEQEIFFDTLCLLERSLREKVGLN